MIIQPSNPKSPPAPPSMSLWRYLKGEFNKFSEVKLSWWLLVHSWKAVWEGRGMLFLTVALDLACLCLIWIWFELKWILIQFDLSMTVNCLWSIGTEMTSQLALNISTWNRSESWTRWYLVIFILVSRKVTQRCELYWGSNNAAYSGSCLFQGYPPCEFTVSHSWNKLYRECNFKTLNFLRSAWKRVRRENISWENEANTQSLWHTLSWGGLRICPGIWLTLL